MSKLKSLVEDFIDIVVNDEEYSHKDWGWDNLPPIETIIDVIERHETDKKVSQIIDKGVKPWK